LSRWYAARRSWKQNWWPEPLAARQMWEELLFSRITLVAVGWVKKKEKNEYL